MQVPAFKPLPFSSAAELVAAFEAGVKFVWCYTSNAWPVLRIEASNNDVFQIKAEINGGPGYFRLDGSCANGIYLALAEDASPSDDLDPAYLDQVAAGIRDGDRAGLNREPHKAAPVVATPREPLNPLLRVAPINSKTWGL